jgi:hypothetical protein
MVEPSSNVPAVPSPANLPKKRDLLLAMAEAKTVPAFMREVFSDADWTTMAVSDRMEAIAFMQAEQSATTDGLEITFPKIKYPTAQAGVWVVPDASGTPQYRPIIAGVVLFKQPVRAYWPIDKPLSNDPPMCSSPDSHKPDTPGPIDPDKGRQANNCAECMRSAFGTGKEGQGQACKARINCFTLMDTNGHDPRQPLALEEIPTLVSVPPSQLRAFSEYAVQVRKSTSGSLLAHTTMFGLKADKNKQGTEFKALVLSTGKKLTYEQMQACRKISDSFEDQFRRRGFVPDDDPAGEKVPF